MHWSNPMPNGTMNMRKPLDLKDSHYIPSPHPRRRLKPRGNPAPHPRRCPVQCFGMRPILLVLALVLTACSTEEQPSMPAPSPGFARFVDDYFDATFSFYPSWGTSHG